MIDPVTIYVGIDPGTTSSGIAVIKDTGASVPSIVAADLLPNGDVMLTLRKLLRACNVAAASTGIAIEEVRSYGMAVGQTTFDTCVWSGALASAIQIFINPMWVIWLGRKADVCTTICQSTRAKDANIRQAMVDYYGVPGTKKERGPTYGVTADMWSALALATTAYRYASDPKCCPESVKRGFLVVQGVD